MLSAGNISIFLSICHEVWDVFLRAERRKPERKRRDPITTGIDPNVQAVAIQTASAEWYEKITEHPEGHDRQRFVAFLGREFRRRLLGDLAMSYPGHNGFSIALDKLEAIPEVKRFLQEAVDYGDLYDAPHTTKEKSRHPRRKWYLSPILSVLFQVPETHVKEPYYCKTAEEVLGWLHEAGVFMPTSSSNEIGKKKKKGRSLRASPPASGPFLFDGLEDQTE
jgi:hypothetical protein